MASTSCAELASRTAAARTPRARGFEKITHLVRSGAYRFIRHPLYASLLALAWGVFLKAPSWLGLLLMTLATWAPCLTAHVEKRENLRNFGTEYSEYV
jgi:protein-S-isoprenylcysteine O-methyltransferase Ste14